jgi:type 2 lantibiotic biosynthesis protein LanM
VARFYEREGALLAILYAIEATDLHSDNVVASGEHPVVVDLEALFHPRFASIADGLFVDPAGQALSESVQRIVLLPERIGATNESPGMDLSGMGFVRHQRSPQPIPKMQGLASDVMRVVYEHESLGDTKSLPAEHVSLVDHVEDVVAGFCAAYDFILEERDAFAAELARFGDVEVRVLLDDTSVYDRLVKSSFHPQYLRDARERERVFDRIHYKTTWRPRARPLLASERLDLARGDVPYFSTTAGSLVVRDARGATFEGVLEKTGIEGALDRLAKMSSRDRDEQQWIIRASFATVPLGEGKLHWKPSALRHTIERVSPARLLDLASRIGERIVERSRQTGAHANWLGIDLVRDREWRLTPLGLDLYNGTPGVCLFLAYLGAMTRRDVFTSTARAALATIFEQMKRFSSSGATGAVGAFGELLSPAYVIVHLARIWKDPALIERAHAAISRLGPQIAADTELDLISGSAGALALLVAIDRAAPSRTTLEAAILAAGRLIACAVSTPNDTGRALPAPRESFSTKPLTGFSHGASGLAFALLRFASIERVDDSLRSACRELARDALRYERSAFSDEHANWPDFRRESVADLSTGASVELRYETAWCHGAPGIALARVAALADETMSTDRNLARELEVATRTTLTDGFGHNHSLCHGDLGNLEAVVTARGSIDDEVRVIAARICDSIERQGPLSGSPLGVETPGLMTGLAGIGFELLRLSDPRRVPSVLTLEAPIVE